MANYYAFARSNYFRVKDISKFEEFCDSLNLTVIKDKNESNLVGFLVEDNDGSLPSYIYNEETDEYEDIDLAEELASHLEEDEVAIFMEVGAEKLRYLVGVAIAVNSKGEIKQVNLGEIYKLADTLGKNITIAEY
jgi:hypothetical protein